MGDIIDEGGASSRARGEAGAIAIARSRSSSGDDSDGSGSFDARWQAESESARSSENGGGNGESTAGDYEEECVICLEELSSQPWGRVTPCGHAFHKKCWWDWENSSLERMDRRRQQEGRDRRSGGAQEGPKCCLCNTVNKQFVDGEGAPANNPAPYVASEDPGDTGGNRFSSFFDEVGSFMDFLGNEVRESFIPRRRSSSATGRSTGTSASPNRRGSSFFGVRGNGSSASPNRSGGFFRNRTSPHRQWQQQSSYTRQNSGSSNPFNLMRPGTQIVTQQLVNSPHLNGRQGTILQYQPDTRRYLVQFQTDVSAFIAGDNVPVAIKPQNLLQTTTVKIHGLQSQPQLNGKEGAVKAFSQQRNRYVVKVDYLLSPTREIAIQPTNMRIPNGTCVRLEGLQRTPHWNGKYGTIVRWVDDRNNVTGTLGRYEVALSRQYAVRVRAENVRL